MLVLMSLLIQYFHALTYGYYQPKFAYACEQLMTEAGFGMAAVRSN